MIHVTDICSFRAWIFGAGLVLGFSMFAGEPRKDIEDSFEGAREVLDDIAAVSPQARLYYEILTSFSEAVNKYRHRVSSEVRRTVQHYMDQILAIDFPRDTNDAGEHYPNISSGNANGNWDEQLAGIITNANANANAIDPGSRTEGAQTLVHVTGYREMHSDWGDIDMQLDEDFILDTGPFEELFYSVE